MYIFDRKLLETRINRFQSNIHEGNFFREEVARRIKERFEYIKPSFEKTLIFGSNLGYLETELRTLKNKFDQITHGEFFPALFDNNNFTDKSLLSLENLNLDTDYYNCIISPLSLHSVNNPKEIFEKLHKSLKKNGMVLIAIPSQGSLENLTIAVRNTEIKLNKSCANRFHPLVFIQNASDLLSSSGFKDVVATTETIEIMYKDPNQIFIDLKHNAETSLLADTKIPLPKAFKKVFNQEFQTYLDTNTNHFPVQINICVIIGWK